MVHGMTDEQRTECKVHGGGMHLVRGLLATSRRSKPSQPSAMARTPASPTRPFRFIETFT